MELDRNRIAAYLYQHIGEYSTSYRTVKNAGAYSGNLENLDINELFELNDAVYEIAEEFGFILNNSHHEEKEEGVPWNLDFLIEQEKDIEPHWRTLPKDLLYRYALEGAFLTPYQIISVYNRESENVHCLSAYSRFVDPKDYKYEILSIDRISLDKIAEILRNNADIFDISYTETTYVMDGVSNYFTFQIDGHIGSIRGDNLWAFEQKDSDEIASDREKADLVLKVFHEIGEILIRNGIDPDYLALDFYS